MLESVTWDEIARIFEVTDALGLHREKVVIPLRPARPGRLRRLPGGKVEIVVDADFEAWLPGLAAQLRALLAS